MTLTILRLIMWTEKGIIPSMGPEIGRGQEAAKMSKKEELARQEEKQECKALSKSDEECIRRRA